MQRYEASVAGYCGTGAVPVSNHRHIPSLDGIRALSFLLVYLAHAGLEKYVPGGMGVTIFFFLSGFLITTLMRVEFVKSGTLNLRHFWLRRIYRIWPAFYLVLLVTALTLGTIGAPFYAQLLHVTNYWIIYHGVEGMPAGTGVYWSLAVEEHFYLLFPWIFLAMQRMSATNQARFLYAICVAVLAWRCWLVFGWHVSADRTYMATDTRIDSIIFGCALAVSHNPVHDNVRLVESRWLWFYVPAATCLMAICLMVRNEAFRETLRYTLQGIALSVLFIAAIRFPRWRGMQLLNSKPAVYIGLLSYSLYLLHFAVIFAVERTLPMINGFEQACFALAISFGLASAIYRLIEKPFARLRHNLK